MKTLRTSLSLLTLLILVLTSCGGNGSKGVEKDGVSFDSIVVDTAVSLTGDTAGPQCCLYLNIAYANGPHAQAINDSLLRSGIIAPDFLASTAGHLSAKAAVDSFVTRFIKEYKSNFRELYLADKQHKEDYDITYTVETSTGNGPDSIVNYTAVVTSKAGRDNGVRQTVARNISLSNGRLTRLADIFVPGYDHSLQSIIGKKIAKQLNISSADSLSSHGIFPDGEIYATENFLLGVNDITFIYCQDEIAPHNMGEIRVRCSRSELKNLLRRQ